MEAVRRRLARAGSLAPALALAALALSVLPAAARAQATEGAGDRAVARPFAVEARGGVAIPGGRLADITDVGGSWGGGVVYRFLPNFAVRGDVDVGYLSSGSDSYSSFPSMRLLHFGPSLEIDFKKPEDQDLPMAFRVNLGVGATSMKADHGFAGPAGQFSHTFFTASGGAEVGYQFNEKVEAFAGGQAWLMVTSASDTRVLTDLSPAVQPFGSAWAFPVQAGVRVSFR